MIDSFRTVWQPGLKAAAQHAAGSKNPVLFRFSRKIQSIDPLCFFAKGGPLFQRRRFIFRDRSGFRVGLGAAAIFRATGSTRFEQIQNEWQKAAAHRVDWNESGEAAIGNPLIFGGFSFDPSVARSPLWDPFSDAFFYLPVWLLQQEGETYRLIHTLICRSGASPDQLLAQFNQEEQLLAQIHSARMPQRTRQLAVRVIPDRQIWRKRVEEALRHMRTSELEKIVLARTLQFDFNQPVSSYDLLKELHVQQPGNYLFGIETPNRAFLGATPERLVKKDGNKLETACVAGSIPRGKNIEEDQKLADALLRDPKNRREHQFVVSMITGALQDRAQRLSFPRQPQILKNKNIQHLYTPVKGTIHASDSIFDFLKVLHPTPALGGTPREEALRWLRAHETVDRGFYGAPIGWCDSEGNGEFVVGIRSVLLAANQAILYAGCGVVAGSDPDREFEETELKFRPILDVLPGEE